MESATQVPLLDPVTRMDWQHKIKKEKVNVKEELVGEGGGEGKRGREGGKEYRGCVQPKGMSEDALGFDSARD